LVVNIWQIHERIDKFFNLYNPMFYAIDWNGQYFPDLSAHPGVNVIKLLFFLTDKVAE